MSYDPSLYRLIQLPPEITNLYQDKRLFTEHIFPTIDLARSLQAPDFFKSRAILSPRNDTAALLNAEILSRLPGDVRHLPSADSSLSDGAIDGLSVEFLQSLKPSGFPPAQLYLKVRAPIMLLRNLHPNEGMCNRTQLVITRLSRQCIEGRILRGKHNSGLRLIPRINLTSKDGDYP